MNKLKFTLICLLSCFSMGCSGLETADKILKVIKDPKIQIGDKNDKPTKISFSLVGEDILNVNYDGDPTPIQISVFQLKDDSKFLAADYDSLVNDPKTMLGKNYIDHEEYSIEPSGYKHIKEVELDPKTEYIGVIAQYSDIDEVLWKKIAKVKPLGEQLHFLILLKDREVKLSRMDK